MRRLIPGYAGMDLSALVLAWLVKTLELFILALLLTPGANPLGALFWALPELLNLTINIFIFTVFVRVILSWINPDPYNPVAGVLYSLTEPIMRPARRLLPPIGGMDLSPILVTIGLILLQMLLIPPLNVLTGKPF